MKRKGNRVLLLGVALAVVLTSCAAPAEQTPTPQESESTTTEATTTTTTTTEATTTTTTAEDTTAITTESTTEATASATETLATDKTTKSTVSKTEKPTATEKTTVETTKSTVSKTEKPTATEKTTVETTKSTVSKTEKPTATEKTTVETTQSTASKTEKPTATEKTTAKTTKCTTKKTTKSPTTEKTVISSTSKPTSKTTKSTTAKTSATATTTRTTYPKDDPNYFKNPPYEDENAVPEKDKQQFLFCVNNEDVTFTFEKAMREPYYDDCLLWYYSGTTEDGIEYTCVVAAEQNKIYQIDCEVNGTPSSIREDTAHVYIAYFNYNHGIAMSTEEITIRKSTFGPPQQPVVSWTVAYPTEYEGNRIGGGLTFINGKVCLSYLKAAHSVLVEGQVKGYPYCLGDEFASLLTPRWKSE